MGALAVVRCLPNDFKRNDSTRTVAPAPMNIIRATGQSDRLKPTMSLVAGSIFGS